MPFLVKGSLFYDEMHRYRVPTPIGPFKTVEDAEQFMLNYTFHSNYGHEINIVVDPEELDEATNLADELISYAKFLNGRKQQEQRRRLRRQADKLAGKKRRDNSWRSN